MTTKIIWINEYRTKLTKLWKDSKKNNIRYIVVVHNKPAFEVIPIFDDIIPEVYHTEILEAKKNEIPKDIEKDLEQAMKIPKEKLYNI